MRRASWITAALLVLAPAVAASARPFFAERGPGRDAGFTGHHAERLGLDTETRNAIDALVTSSRSEGFALRTELREAQESLQALLAVETPDEDAVMRQVEAVGLLETQIKKHRLRTLLAIRALLTPEQRAELEAIRDEGPFHRFAAVLDACRDDVDAACPDTAPGPERLFRLKRRADAVSAPCRDALEALPDHPGRRGRGRPGRR